MIASPSVPTHARPRPAFQTDALRALYHGKITELPGADHLRPGHVLVSGRSHLQRLVVLAAALEDSGERVKVTRRPLMGGGAATVLLRASKPVKVNGFGPHDEFTPELVPAVPAAGIPGEPAEGDEIWSQSAVSGAAHGILRYTRRGGAWTDTFGAGCGDRTVRRLTASAKSLAVEWYVYRPAGAELLLYVDGVPHRVKRARDLAVGDRLPAPGGALSRITDKALGIPCQEHLVWLEIVAEELSAYPWAPLLRGVVKGAVHTEWRRLDAMVPVLTDCHTPLAGCSRDLRPAPAALGLRTN